MGQRQIRDKVAIAPTSLSLPSVEDIIWQNDSGVEVDGNTLKKITGSGLWDAGAESQQRILSGDCAVEMTVGYPSHGAIGFSATNPDNDLDTIKWSIRTEFVNGYYAIANLPSIPGSPFGSVTEGDTARVAIEGLNVSYYINAIKVRSFALTSVPYPLLVDCSIARPNSSILNARLIRGAGITANSSIKGKGIERSGYRLIQSKERSVPFNVLHPLATWLPVFGDVIKKTSINSLIEVRIDIPRFGITGGANCNAKLAIFRNDEYWEPIGSAVASFTVSEACHSISKQWIDYEAGVDTAYSIELWCDRYATTNGQAMVAGNSDSPSMLTLREWYQD